jgi:hypothetical protein
MFRVLNENHLDLRTTRRSTKDQKEMNMIHRQSSHNKYSIDAVRRKRVFNEVNSARSEEDFIRINVRYLNHEGRQLALMHAVDIHHDFDDLSPIVTVTILRSSLPLLQAHPSIEYADGDGAVIFL